MSWDNVCKTKSEGGLGIKRIKDIAKATAVKMLWNFIQGDTLWGKWMHNKYCKNDNFWTALINNNASNTWKLILRAREWCKGMIDRKIATGEKSTVWFDPWIKGILYWTSLGGIICTCMVAIIVKFPL